MQELKSLECHKNIPVFETEPIAISMDYSGILKAHAIAQLAPYAHTLSGMHFGVLV